VSKTILGNFLFIYLFNELTQDHIERGSIDLSQLKFRVLDEADEMLRMGFVEDVELILGVSLYFSILLSIHGALLKVSKFAAIVC
jgi:hypothetical protein